MNDWKNLQYLQQGTLRQRQAYLVLEEFALWATLSDFEPILAGTIPMVIDLLTSDLNIVCEVPSPTKRSLSR